MSSLSVTQKTQVLTVKQASAPTLSLKSKKQVLKVSEKGVQGPKGEPGDAGSRVEPIIFRQETPSSIWTIAHNLGFRADVTIYDEADELILADIRHDSDNQVTIVFSEPTSGVARID